MIKFRNKNDNNFIRVTTWDNKPAMVNINDIRMVFPDKHDKSCNTIKFMSSFEGNITVRDTVPDLQRRINEIINNHKNDK